MKFGLRSGLRIAREVSMAVQISGPGVGALPEAQRVRRDSYTTVLEVVGESPEWIEIRGRERGQRIPGTIRLSRRWEILSISLDNPRDQDQAALEKVAGVFSGLSSAGVSMARRWAPGDSGELNVNLGALAPSASPVRMSIRYRQLVELHKRTAAEFEGDAAVTVRLLGTAEHTISIRFRSWIDVATGVSIRTFATGGANIASSGAAPIIFDFTATEELLPGDTRF